MKVTFVAWCLIALFAAQALGGSESPATPPAQRGISYVPNGDARQTFDLYLPDGATGAAPLLVWMHGGAWKVGDKNWINVRYLVRHGYALASVDYRLSGQARFPAQIQDCNAALSFLMANSEKYGFDRKRLIVGGASAGGHLALLLGLARNEKSFGADPNIQPRAILDFFGPTDLTTVLGELPAGHGHDTIDEATRGLLGGTPDTRAELAKEASPVSYVHAGNPPVLVAHGEKDDLVPISQSTALLAKLNSAGVKSLFVSVKEAGHDGLLFEAPAIQQKVLSFLLQALEGTSH